MNNKSACRRKPGIILFLALLIISGQVWAQNSSTHDDNGRASVNARLKVGLVLSGGGARGVAHVGVVEWLEKNRIPVDYITGTSMGGLIGAIYATGRTPDEMKSILRDQNWERLLSSGPSYRELAYRRKDDRRSYQIGLDLGYRDGLSLPLGVSSAHYIGLLIDRLTLPYSNLKNFDELPIPYRCVATDMLAAKPLVLQDGSLSSAMRATMSIPGVFPPVERDKTVLVDGGLLNNIPTDVMRSFKPDVVIAVDVGSKLGDIETLRSLVGILQQSIAVMTIESDRRNLALADLIIAPELGDLSVLDFTTIEKSFEIGYQAAESKANILKKFALSPEEWEQYVAERNSRIRTEAPIPDRIEVAGNDQRLQRSLTRRLESQIGKPVNVEKIEEALNRVTGQGKYESLDYGFRPSSPNPGINILEIRAKEKPHSPPSINTGVIIDGSDINSINFTIGGRLTIYDTWRRGTEWRIDTRLGFENLFSTEYFIPLGHKGFFVAPHAGYRRERQGIYLLRNRFTDYQVDRGGAGLDFGFLTDRSEIRVGYELRRITAKSLIGLSSLPRIEGNASMARIQFTFDGQDSQTIPRSGVRLVADGRWYFTAPDSERAFPLLEIRSSAFKPVTEKGSLFGAFSGGTAFKRTAPFFQEFLVGGPFRFGALERDEIRANHYGLATVGYLHSLYQLPSLIGSSIYAGGWVDQLGTWGGAAVLTGDQRYRSAVSAGIILDSKLGPFSIVGSWGEQGRGQVYFSLGRFF